MQEKAIRFCSRTLRKTILDMAYAGSTVHIGCAFSIVEILAVLHAEYLNYPENRPDGAHRDYLVLSKGHGVMAQYACMHARGWLEDSAVVNYFSNGSALKGLSDSRVPGLEVTSGSLGHGFSVGVGLALGAKMRDTTQKTYVIVGDGELNEGPIWEAALFSAHHKLDNLLVIVDENGLQAMGKTSEVMALNSIQEKFKSFGFFVMEVDGHDEQALTHAIAALWRAPAGMPLALVAKTTKGKGVTFMEHDNAWHYSRLTPDLYAKALAELEGAES